VKILVADRQLVRPGDCLAILEGDEIPPGPGLKHFPDKHVYVVGEKVYSDVLGVVSIEDGKSISVIPLESVYIPRKDDVVIGIVVDIGLTAWLVDIKAPYKAILPAGDVIEGFNPAVHNLKSYLDVGDFVVAKVAAFDRLRDPLLTVKGKGLGKVTEGFVIDIKPSKVARVIGKKGSMYNVLVSYTKCEVLVGSNGYILAKCPSEQALKALIKAIKLIEAKAHLRGLTEEVKTLLELELGVKA
jgi:exosome complex component RRP4